MRGGTTWLVVFVLGCGSVRQPAVDASAVDAPDVDGDPDAACQPRMLLVGGTDVTTQGWSLVTQAPAQLSDGPDFVKLQTTTNVGATTSGQLLLNYPGAIEPGKPFKLEVVMLVEAVNPHNQFDSGATIMGSFTPPFGAGNDRSAMIYLDSSEIGWGDETQTFDAPVQNNAYHAYELSVDASGAASVRVDGTVALTRSGFTSNGAIAIGDQTNDANVDGTVRIRSVILRCP